MSNISFENFGVLADSISDHTQVAGRYFCQRDDEKNILLNVIHKLDLSPSDRLLEIGCGTGNLLIPLSFFVRSVTGVDHPSCVKALNKRFKADTVSLIGRNFLDCQDDELGFFDKILVYSVLHYLAEDAVKLFIDKGLSLLRPGGKMLLGDIPNISKKKRFLSSRKGQAFVEGWNKKIVQTCDENQPASPLQEDADTVKFDDSKLLLLLEDIRRSGFNAYIMPQPVDLPFGHTREDILIEGLD